MWRLLIPAGKVFICTEVCTGLLYAKASIETPQRIRVRHEEAPLSQYGSFHQNGTLNFGNPPYATCLGCVPPDADAVGKLEMLFFQSLQVVSPSMLLI